MMEFPFLKKNNNMGMIQSTRYILDIHIKNMWIVLDFYFAISLILVPISQTLVPYSGIGYILLVISLIKFLI